MASVFMSYSHNDEDLRQELEKHLSSLRRQGVIRSWHDRRIGPGEEIHSQISAHLDAADIILLLVSADFLASDYCYDREMMRAMERHEEGSARVIPVILRPCDWQASPFGHLNAVPTDGKPVTKHPTLDAGFVDVAKAVRHAAESICSDRLPTADHGNGHRESVDPQVPGPRSSRLRVKRSFSDQERYVFLNEAFEFISRYFENSLRELQIRNSFVETDFKRIDANGFEAVAFVGGLARSRCGIWVGGLMGRDGLYFSSEGIGQGNSFNESMSIGDDGYTLCLNPMGMAWSGERRDANLTHEGAAEYFWELFSRRLQ